MNKAIFSLGFKLALFVGIVLANSCYYDNREELYQFLETPCELDAVSYTAHIQPLLASNCAYSGCHAGPASAAGLDLSTHAGAAAGVLNGQVINRIERANGEAGQMPPSGKMGDCQINQIKEWALAGAPNN